MGALNIVLCGVVAYLLLLETILRGIAFIDDPPAPCAIDGGQSGIVDSALVIEVTLLGLFAI